MRSKLKNQILSWVVAAVLTVGLLPVLNTLALAAEDDEITAIRTTTLAPTAGVSDSNEAEGWSWNGTTNTLTLTNAYIVPASGDGIILPADSKIVLVGNNILRSADNSTDRMYGIKGAGALTIEGVGSLIVTGGTATNGYSYGIYATTIAITSGTVIATGGTSTGTNGSTGICAESTVNINGGTVTATGGTGYSSNGIYAVSAINLNGGVVIARSGKATALSKAPILSGVTLAAGAYNSNYAVYAPSGTFNGLYGATLPTTGSGAGYSWSGDTLTLNGVCINTSSTGGISLPAGATIVLQGVNVVRTATGLVCISGEGLSISGTGSLIAIGGNSSSYSYGISISSSSTATISGGMVTAIGGTSSTASYGIGGNSINVTGGMVTAIGGTSSSNNSRGISANATISGGTVNAIGGTAGTGSSHGIYGTFTMNGGRAKLYGNTASIVGTTNFANNIGYIAGSQAGKAAVLGIVAYAVTLNGNGGSGTELTSYTYGIGAVLPDWTKEGYTFGGWYDNATCTGDSITEITAADSGDKEYWAKWTKITKVIEVTDDTANGNIAVTANAGNLDEVFDRVVTQADVAGDNVVKLSLNVNDITTQTSEVEAIKTAADKGSEVYFFDVTLTKQINNDAPTTLTNIPVPVEVHIKLTGDLAGKAYYKVYRYHNNQAEQISNDTTKTEHYKVDIENSEIVIYTMKFSTYAIFGNDISLQDLSNGGGEDMDVQAKITDASLGVYKVDIAWGAMTFEWNASGQEWNPDTHAYDPIPGNGVWTDASHNGENNRIVCANHSNGSLLATFDVSGTLGGVTYDVFTDNDVKDTAATDMSLPKVPNETATAPEIRAYLWLTGEPDGTAMAALSNIWQKVGVITITFTPDAGDTDKTPKIEHMEGEAR